MEQEKRRPGRKKGSPGAVKPDAEKKLHITRLGLNDVDQGALEARLDDLGKKGTRPSRAGYFRGLFLEDIQRAMVEKFKERAALGPLGDRNAND